MITKQKEENKGIERGEREKGKVGEGIQQIKDSTKKDHDSQAEKGKEEEKEKGEKEKMTYRK